MDVCLSFGSNSKAIINKISSSTDNVRYFTYNNVQEIIQDAKLRHLSFKRIIISPTILVDPQHDLEELNDFIKNYSSSSELVLVTKKGYDNETAIIPIFMRFFNAPLYTPVVLPKATGVAMTEVVLNDIQSLAVKYYELNKKEENTETGELVAVGDSGADDSQSVPSSVQSSGFGFGSKNSFVSSESAGGFGSNWVEPKKDKPVSLDGEDTGFSFSSDGDGETDELSIGDYGSQHSDTGFLDTAEDEELQAMLNNDKGAVGSGNAGVDISEPDELDLAEQQAREDKERRKREKAEAAEEAIQKERVRYRKESRINTNLNIDVVISCRSLRATQAIVDEAMNLYKEDDAKILIIDLDCKENRVLSLLDTEKFYSTNSFEGITKQRVYVEDHVGICSNGFGVKVSTKDLKALLASKLVSKFDLILIDCPSDCLGVFDDELIRMSHVLIYTGNSREELTEISENITDRSNVKLQVEKFINKSCEIELVGGTVSQEDKDYIRKMFLFANGCWLKSIIGVSSN